ncbi:hypothetical protein BV898_04941 [Hypsibius exemplaris]|uniref:Chitin-binding type-2 domain-containing protein n=1 Tax=Hypsibius exemplaris TaxID=2072580 RepID=A0A1W0X164_HYPEX|nr:hypothetical protein BV898_04941 [Hypsibius exemplaris]
MRRFHPFVGLFLLSGCGFELLNGHDVEKRQALNVQNPPVWQALDVLRGSVTLDAAQVQQLIASAVPGQTYPTLSYIPQTGFTCSSARQPGFYADPDTGCQVFRRCEANNYMFSYICPNSTLFNQITLVCDYWYNVQCGASQQFVDYSNPRIYNQNARLLDDVDMGGASGSGNYAGSSGHYEAGGGGNAARYSGGQVNLGGGNAAYSTGNAAYSSNSAARLQNGGTYSGLQQSTGGSSYQTANLGASSGVGLYGSGQPSSYGGGSSRGVVSSGYASSQPSSSSYISSAYSSPAQQQQLPFGTQVNSYPARPQVQQQQQQPQPAQYQSQQQPQQQQSSSYQQPSPQFQQPSGYASQQSLPSSYSIAGQPSYSIAGQPSYRSLSNRLLRLQADASEPVTAVVTTQVSAPSPLATESIQDGSSVSVT